MAVIELVDEGFLASLGVHRLDIPVPFIEAGGPANVYAIENDDRSYTLFDTGIGTAEGTQALHAGLAARGISRESISRLVISHGHVDHYGNAQALAEASGARVWVHPHDLEKVCGDGRWAGMLIEHRAYFLALGIPAEVLDGMVRTSSQSPLYARQVERSRISLLEEGQVLNFKRFDAEVLHLPGHTPGLVCLYASAQRLLFADDHVLARVSPNPLLDLSLGEGETKFRALVSYLEGAHRVHALELDCVLPGHGAAFRNHRGLLDGLFEFYRRRQRAILDALAAGPATAYTLVKAIFPGRDARRPFLTLSEVVGNLEVLEAEAKVRRSTVDGVFHFQLA